MGTRAGLSARHVEQLANWEQSHVYGEVERVLLAFTDQLVLGADVDDATLDAVSRHFPPEQLVELALTVSFYCMAPRVVHALRVPLMETPTPTMLD
jgi:alkylhydroperoxidase family enzyme